MLVTYGSEGLCLYDTKYEVRHRWKHREPSKQSPSSPNSRRHCGSWRRGHGHDKQIKRPAPERPDDAEPDLKVKTEWLLQTYAYCPPLDKVVDMYKAHDINCLLKRDAFVYTYRGWSEPKRGATGNILVKPKLATDDWSGHKLIVEGIRMRPDMPFPLYEENGLKFKNTLLPAGAQRRRRYRAVPRFHGSLPAGQSTARMVV